MYHILAFILHFIISDSGQPELSSPEKFKQYVCYKTNAPLIIDGKLDEGDWTLAPFSDLFVDIEGESKPAPLEDTRVKILWDQEYLYVGVWLQEAHIWATYTERESVIFHENDFEIFIDPTGDTHNYYEIEINALNTIWDLMLTKPYRDHGKALNSWDAIGMKTAVHLEGTINDPSDIDSYWSIEFAIPWSSMKEFSPEKRNPKDGEQWRMNFSRVQWRLDIVDGGYSKQIDPTTNKSYPENNWVWSPQGVIAMHQPETWGFVQFSDIKVGDDKAEFVFNKNEFCKWELRKIYYSQNDFKLKNEVYPQKNYVLETIPPGCSNPNLKLTSFDSKKNEYQYQLACENYSQLWNIQQDGKIWPEINE